MLSGGNATDNLMQVPPSPAKFLQGQMSNQVKIFESLAFDVKVSLALTRFWIDSSRSKYSILKHKTNNILVYHCFLLSIYLHYNSLCKFYHYPDQGTSKGCSLWLSDRHNSITGPVQAQMYVAISPPGRYFNFNFKIFTVGQGLTKRDV